MTDILSFDSLYPGRFLKAGMFNGQPVTYTIKSIQHDEIEGDKGAEKKVVISFRETPFELVLPKINAVAIKAMFGPQVQEWIGKRVTLYGTTAIMPFPKKKDEPCIRVFGSPDIKADIRCEWSPPRRKAVVQILKPMQSPVLTAALAAIEAAPEGAPMGKLQERANQLLAEKKINDKEYDEIDAAIQQRIQRTRAAQKQQPAAAEPAPDPEGADGGDSQVANPESPTADAGEPPTLPAQHDPGGDPVPDAVNPSAEPAVQSPDLTLRERQQLIRTVNACAQERREALLAALVANFQLATGTPIAPQLRTQAHADFVAHFLAS